MASTTVNGVDEFFQVVASGSVNDLCKILEKEGPEKSSKLAQSYNEKGETPLLVAIGKKQFPVMNMLVDLLGVNIGQIGHFTSNGVDYADCPPLFAAIVSDEVSCIDYLFKKRITRDRPSLDLNSFMSSSITCRQKANILMLFGATYMLSESYPSLVTRNVSNLGNVCPIVFVFMEHQEQTSQIFSLKHVVSNMFPFRKWPITRSSFSCSWMLEKIPMQLIKKATLHFTVCWQRTKLNTSLQVPGTIQLVQDVAQLSARIMWLLQDFCWNPGVMLINATKPE